MFGYVLPRMDKLSGEAADRYHAAYCGLCSALQRGYGFRARFLVNYDMTFLYFLLQSSEPFQPKRCFCPARPLCRKDCLPDDAVMQYAADLSVLLSYWKLLDAKRDGRLPHRIAARLAMGLLCKSYRKAVKRLTVLDRSFGQQLARLQQMEDAHCASIDRTADAFARLLCDCAAYLENPSERRTVELLLYHLGRYLYLTDALEDLPKDNRSGSYNPLRYRYILENGALCGKDKIEFLETVDASISMAASALELLPERADDEILRNIIYYGLPAVLHSVAEGTFRKRKNRRNT